MRHGHHRSGNGGLMLRERLWPEEMERFFDRTMRGFWPSRRIWGRLPELWREGWIPDMDVFEREGKTVVRLDLPGMKREDIDVAVEDDALVIRGRREEEHEVKEEDYYCSERATGEFSRAIALPEGVDPDSIEATYENGVLEVTVPHPKKAEESKAVHVTVK